MNELAKINRVIDRELPGVSRENLLVLDATTGQNAIIQAAKLGVSIDGATLYCTHQPCSVCAKMIINAGIRRVVYQEGYPDSFSLDIFEEAKVQLERFDPETAPEINP